MEKSQEIKELAVALNKFQSEVGVVAFDASNPFFKSKYATLSALVEKARPVLTKFGLCVSQLVEGEGSVTTILIHISGQYISSTLTLKPVKDDPQGHGSSITYSRRYAYAAILGLVSDEDDDGNAASVKQEKPTLITMAQVNTLVDMLNEKGLSHSKMCQFMSVDKIENIKSSDYQKAYSLVNSAKKVTNDSK